MAHTVQITKYQDGPRYATYLVYLESDGSSVDLSKEVLIDPTEFDPASEAKPILSLDKMQYSLEGFSARLEFDYLASNTFAWVLTQNNEAEVCFKEFGGLHDKSNELDGTGKLLLTTSGLTAGTWGTILIRVRKE